MIIGELIKDEVRRQQISIVDFAKRINCQRNNVYDIFLRTNMDIVQLKLISKVLNRNFFRELADNLELINDREESDEDKIRRKAVSQFYDAVPNVLRRLGRSSIIVFSKDEVSEYEDCSIPDFVLPEYFITFTIGETFKERMGNNSLLSISEISNIDGFTVEKCTNNYYGTISLNIKLDYKTEEEWQKVLAFAFEIYDGLRMR